MANYYTEKLRCNQEIDSKINRLFTEPKYVREILINAFIIELTAHYEVSEKAILQRIKMHLSVNTNLKHVRGKIFVDPQYWREMQEAERETKLSADDAGMKLLDALKADVLQNNSGDSR